MGFLDSYFRLSALTDEMSEKSDVGASLTSMQTKLDGLNASMAASVPVVADPAKQVDATAVVTASRVSGAQVSGAMVVELELLVTLPGGIPLPVSQSTLVPLADLGRISVGCRLAVTLDPVVPATLAVDWTRAAA